MATLDMAMILGGVLVPYPSNFNKIINPNETNNITLGGRLSTDFINTRRAWRVTWKNMTRENYQIIYNIWAAQYTNFRYTTLQFNAYNIYCPVKIDIMPEHEIKYNGSLISSFYIILSEQEPIS